MTDVMYGSEILENQGSFENLPPEFFELIDPMGANVIIDDSKKIHNGRMRFVGLFKLKERTLPLEMYMAMPLDEYIKLVHPVELKSLISEIN